MSLNRNWLFPVAACSGIAGVLVIGLVVVVVGLIYWDPSEPTATLTPTSTPTTTLTLTAAPTTTSTLTAAPTATLVSPIITLPNCYQISFRGFVNNGDGTTTWTYFVEELACAQDLSNWIVELPICARVIGATPSPWELVNPDPNYHLSGIKWQVGAGFTSGEFSVTLSGDLTVGPTAQVGAKGPDIAIATIAGPVCSEPLPISTMTLIATTTVTTTPTALVTVTPPPTLIPTAIPTPPPPSPTSPPPTSPPSPAGGSPIVITDNNQTQTLTCNGNSVMINGNDNTITLRGSCGAVTIRGNNNWVSIQSATSITNTGNNNTIVQ